MEVITRSWADHVTSPGLYWSDPDLLPHYWSEEAASDNPSSTGSSEIIIEQRISSNKVSNQRLKYWSGTLQESEELF